MTDDDTSIADTSIAMRSFDASLPMALLRAREATMQYFRPLLADHGITEQKWRVLRALAAAPEPIEVSRLAEITALLPPSVSRIVARLNDDGMIERKVVPADTRRSTLELTAEGRRFVGHVAPHSEVVYEQIEASFGKTRLAALLAELHDFVEITDKIDADVESPAEESSP
ncbi:MAG: homoprotocatechuate degradation operon regulator HpaR [Actinomycetota bacterium]